AIGEARSALVGAIATDRVCVMSFDKSARTLIGFEQWQMLEPARRVPVAIEEISKLSPGWNGTALGQALVNAAEAIEDDEANEQQRAASLRQVVLVSDLQQGSRLAALRSYEWPERTELAVKPIAAKGTTNATLQLLTDRDDLAVADGQYRAPVRITNSPDATKEQFTVRWAGQTGPDEADWITDVYVAPGHSAVVHVRPPAGEQAGRRLILTGDDHEFDNTLYLAPQLKQQINIVYIGTADPNNPKEMLYYVRRCFDTSRALNPRIILSPSSEEIADAHFVIIADLLEQNQTAALRQYLESGRTALLAMKSPQAATDVGALTGIGNLQAEEAEVERYAMLDRIEFNHPLLAPFAEPQFGDFTRIHFWKHRTIDMARMPDARVLVSFDSNEPAVIEQPVGAGSLLVLTSSWHPSDSQLALSSKFVPLLYSVLEYGGVLVGQRSQHFVGDNVPVSYSQASQPTDMKIRKPDGSLISHELWHGLPAREDTAKMAVPQPSFVGADQPGIYTIESSAQDRLFAVNLPVAESRTAPMSVEEFEGLGVSLGQSSNVPTELVKQASRRSSFVDLEFEQKLWRWALVALLAVALIETWLAGWLTRSRPIAGREQQ
ncbi:MAG: vWA domain-containing protein, partial [Planctomycetota bacterium]